MPDKRFFKTGKPLTMNELSALIGLGGDVARCDDIKRIGSPFDTKLNEAVVFVETPDAADAVSGKEVGLCLTNSKMAARIGSVNGPLWVAPAPKFAFARIASALHVCREEDRATNQRTTQTVDGAHPSAVIAADAEIGGGASIGANAYIGAGVVIGAHADIAPNASITNALIGDRISVFPGAAIGQSGFGFAHGQNGEVLRMPQLGRVILGHDVEIGANTTIDRGALGDTTVGDGAKIDNLVQIGHNVSIGRHCMIAALTGISGSCVIGDGAMIGGQVGFANHVSVGENAQIAARSGLMRDVPANEKWGGAPAQPIREWLREMATLSKLARKEMK